MKNELLSKDIKSLLKELAIPSIIGILFNTFYNVIDTFYAGLISTNALAGLSMSFFLYYMIVGIGFGFSSAITALIGNSLGKNKQFLAKIYANKGIVFMFLLGAFSGTLGFIFSPDLLKFMGASEEYLPYGLEYIRVLVLATPLFLTTYSLNAILVAKGDTKSYRNTLVIGFFLNLALNPLFIYGFLFIPALGVSGIALATVLVQVISIILLGIKVIKINMLCLNLKMYLPDFRIYKNFLSQGLPSSLNSLTMALGGILLMFFVAKYGIYAVAGYGVAIRVEQILLLPALGISSATLTLIANNYGAKKLDRVSQIYKISLKYSFIISCIGIILALIFGKFALSLFDDNLEVIEFASEYLYIEVFAFFGYSTLFISVSFLQGIKKPKMIFYVGLYRQILAKLAIFYPFVFWLKLPIISLWLGLLGIIYSAAVFMYLYCKEKIKTFKPY